MPHPDLFPEDEALPCSLPSGRPRFERIVGNCTLIGWLARGALLMALFAGSLAFGRSLGRAFYHLLH